MFYQVFTGKTCFPLPVLLGGSFYSDGTTITTNTVSSLSVGNYLYSSTNNEIKEIIAVGASGNTFTIKSAFTLNVSSDAQDLIQITDTSVDYYEVDILNFGYINGKLNGATYPINLIANIKEHTDPLIFTIDATGTYFSILALS